MGGGRGRDAEIDSETESGVSGVTAMRVTFLAAALCAASPAHAIDPLDAAIDATLESHRDGARAQHRIDNVAADTEALVEDYRRIVQQADSVRVYNDQLERLVAAQKAELDGYGVEIATAQLTRDKLLPLMQTMARTLEEFVQRDLPFLGTERKTRGDAMKAMVDEPDLSPTEKFRRLMEAWQIEADYGHTIEAYGEPVQIAGQQRMVDVLRIGRVALLYLTFDRREAGYWDQQDCAWKTLPAEYVHRIARGLQIASRAAPPEILALPVAAPEGRP